MRRAIFLLAACALISGCATLESYENKLNGWKGFSESQLLLDWGPPTKVEKIDEAHKVLTYNWSGSKKMALPADVKGTACLTQFTLENGTVKSWKYEGSDCRSV